MRLQVLLFVFLIPILSYNYANVQRVLKHEPSHISKVNVRHNDDISCTDLMEYVKDNGYRKNSVSGLQLFDSSWLKSVEAYEYKNNIFVIAEVKKDQYGFSTKHYIFCGIPSTNWDRFYYGLHDVDKTYGERFQKYIIDYKCNCN